MLRESPSQFQQYMEFRCRDCGSAVGFRSRRRTFSERYILPLFLLQPVRCAECFRRDYRLVFTAVKDRPLATTGMIPLSERSAPPRRNVA